MHPYRPLQLPDSTVLREIWQEIENKSLQKKDLDVRCGEPTTKGTNSLIKSSSLMNSHGEDTDKSNLTKQQVEVDEGVKPPNTYMEAHSPKSAWERIVASANTSKETSAGNDLYSAAPLEQIQLALSFRANLPADVPPTMSTECVKYFYSAVLIVTTAEGEVGIHSSLFYLFLATLRILVLHCLLTHTFIAPHHPLPICSPHVQLTVLSAISSKLFDTSSYWRSSCDCPLGCSADLHLINRSFGRHSFST